MTACQQPRGKEREDDVTGQGKGEMSGAGTPGRGLSGMFQARGKEDQVVTVELVSINWVSYTF